MRITVGQLRRIIRETIEEETGSQYVREGFFDSVKGFFGGKSKADPDELRGLAIQIVKIVVPNSPPQIARGHLTENEKENLESYLLATGFEERWTSRAIESKAMKGYLERGMDGREIVKEIILPNMRNRLIKKLIEEGPAYLKKTLQDLKDEKLQVTDALRKFCREGLVEPLDYLS
jgi:hypothetical protein